MARWEAEGHLGWMLFWRDFSSRERRNVLGMAWWLVSPLAAAMALVLLHRRGILDPGDGSTYPLYVTSGILLWQIFAEALLTPIRVFGSARPMFSQVALRPGTLVLAALLEAGFHAGIRLVILGMLLGGFGVFWPLHFMAAMAGACALVFAGFVIGLWLAPLSVLSQDISQGLAVILPVWFVLTPIAYFVPGTDAGAVLAAWNPAAVLIGQTREALLGRPQELTVARIAWSGALILVTPLAFGWIQRSFAVIVQKAAEEA